MFVEEPGYYKAESFGVRIESIIQVVDDPDKKSYFNGRGALKFDDVTMAPIDKKLIDVTLLTSAEVCHKLTFFFILFLCHFEIKFN